MGLKCYCGGTFEEQIDYYMWHSDFRSDDSRYTRKFMECDKCSNQYMTGEQTAEAKCNLDAVLLEDGKIDHEAEAIATIKRYTDRGGIIPFSKRDSSNQALATQLGQHGIPKTFITWSDNDLRIRFEDDFDSMARDLDPVVQQELLEMINGR